MSRNAQGNAITASNHEARIDPPGTGDGLLATMHDSKLEPLALEYLRFLAPLAEFQKFERFVGRKVAQGKVPC